MYSVSEFEYLQYETAETRLKELKHWHVLQIKEAYDGIHPTRTRFNYDSGTIWSESVNPFEYAVYLIELKEEHARVEKWWKTRALLFQKAISLLPEEEMKKYQEGSYFQRSGVKRRLKVILGNLLTERKELQRTALPLDELEDIDEVDRRIDAMTDEELLEDYWDKDEWKNDLILEEKCVRLYETHDMTYKMVGEKLGIESSRVKEYVTRNKRRG